MDTFQGIKYKDASNWLEYVPQTTGPIRYMEIGVLCGNNLLSVEKLYASHPDSVLVCIDPWEDYGEYPEYKGEITTYYDMFLNNTAHIKDKLEIHRSYSHKVMPTLEDDSFDIVYIDGNHEPEYVMEDGVLAFRKVKVGGWLIFDDYEGPDIPRAIRAFVEGYKHRISRYINIYNNQVFIQRTS